MMIRSWPMLGKRVASTAPSSNCSLTSSPTVASWSGCPLRRQPAVEPGFGFGSGWDIVSARDRFCFVSGGDCRKTALAAHLRGPERVLREAVHSWHPHLGFPHS